MRRISWLIPALAFGCGGGSSSSTDPGMETGPCVQGACFPGLQCLSNVCVNNGNTDGKSDTSAASAASTTGPPATSSVTSTTSMISATSGPNSTSTSSSTSAATTSNTTGGTTSDTTSGTTSVATSSSFVTLDSGSALECSVWDQDCPAGQKCAAWANDGGNSWNATRCVNVDPTPDGVGSPCTVQGSGTSGVDSCVAGAMCWDVDPVSLVGTCIAQCTGSEAAPMCAAGSTCSISNGGVLILCLPDCDPLMQDCTGGEGCYPMGSDFICAPDSSGSSGGYGSTCVSINGCDPGLACLTGSGIPGCPSSACCSPFCDLSDPNASANCPGASGGQQCVPALSMPPAQYVNVGYCYIPA